MVQSCRSKTAKEYFLIGLWRKWMSISNRFRLIIAVSAAFVLAGGLIAYCNAYAAPKVWVVSDMDRVGLTEAPKDARDIELFAAKGEYAAFQVVVHGPENGLANTNLEVSDLKGPDGGVITGSNLTLYREHYIEIKHPTWDRGTVKSLGAGWYADALIPFVDPATGKVPVNARFKAADASVKAGENQPYWIDVFVPRDAKPGKYEGSYTLTSKQGKATGKITLNVWNFALPEKPSAGSMFVVWTDNSLEAKAEITRHKMMPVRPQPDQVEYLAKNCGLSIIETGFWSGADIGNKTMEPAPPVEQIKAKVSSYPSDLRKINYTADEIANAPKLNETFRQWGKNLHEAGVEQLLVGPPIPELFDDGTGKPSIDIYVIMPVHYDMKPEYVKQAMDRGIEIWSYTTANQDDYAPKWQVDFAPINYRAFQGFINQSMGFEGYLYWAVDRWLTKDPWTDLDDKVDGGYYPANSTLAFPGKDVGIKGVVPSMRMKWIRKGFDDYEYVEMLKKTGQKDLALKLSQSVSKDWREWSRDPAQYEKVRREIGQILSKGK